MLQPMVERWKGPTPRVQHPCSGVLLMQLFVSSTNQGELSHACYAAFGPVQGLGPQQQKPHVCTLQTCQSTINALQGIIFASASAAAVWAAPFAPTQDAGTNSEELMLLTGHVKQVVCFPPSSDFAQQLAKCSPMSLLLEAVNSFSYALAQSQLLVAGAL